MTVDKRQVPENSPEDLSDLLSEVRRADAANDPCTREFLQAGERLLHDILARDTGEIPGRARAPFYELLACVSRRQVVDEAEGSWTGQGGTAGKPTESRVPAPLEYAGRLSSRPRYLFAPVTSDITRSVGKGCQFPLRE